MIAPTCSNTEHLLTSRFRYRHAVSDPAPAVDLDEESNSRRGEGDQEFNKHAALDKRDD